jgi:uncharacterized protein (TIGR02391 family)
LRLSPAATTSAKARFHGYDTLMSAKLFRADELQAIADAMADTHEGLTGSEIAYLLETCSIADPTPAMNKRHRLYNAFVGHQNSAQSRVRILGFIRKSMRPARFARDAGRFEPLRRNLNIALAFSGLVVEASGELVESTRVQTLTEAQQRANDLRADLNTRGVHPDVLAFCREELLTDNYFHAVLEAVKSIGEKIRKKTGLTADGGTLIDLSLLGKPPMIAINPLKTESEISEQKGFANLIKGTFGMFRNPTAHEARVNWEMTKEDAEDLLSIVSMIHKRLDKTHMPPRV